MNRRQVILVTVCHMFTDINQGALPALLPFVRRDLGGGYFEAALVSSAFLLGIVVGSPIAGGAVDAFGVRRSIIVGCGVPRTTAA